MAMIKQRDKRSGITYVYESISYWDKEKQQPRSKRTLIGRLDPETGEVYKLRTGADGAFDKEDTGLIIDAAIDFLKLVRKNNPTSHIVWLYGMLGYDLTLPLTEAVNRYIVETGDNNIRFLQLPAANDETIGARWHPGIRSHEIAAGIIKDYLKAYFNSQP